MSNTGINHQSQELNQALTQASPRQATGKDPSISLTSASALHLSSALSGATAAVSPTTLSMLSKQKQELDAEGQRFAQIVETLASQVESLGSGAPLAAGDPNALASLLSQRYLGEAGQAQGFDEAYSAQLGPHTDLSLFSMLAQESKKLDPKARDSKKAEAKGRNAIFEAAGKMQKLVKDSENSMIQSLERQIQMLEEQLKSMEEMMKFMEQEGKYLTNYLNNPSLKNLEALVSFLKQHFEGDPTVEKMLDELSKLGKILKDLFGSKVEKKFWGKIANKAKIKQFGNQTINEFLSSLMGQVSGNSGLFTEFMRYGQKDFEQIVERLITNLAEVIMLYDVLTGKGSGAIFDMESILMNLEQVAIKSNSKQSEQRKQMADEVQKGLENTMNKLIKAQHKIAEAEKKSHHHGIFGAIGDFFKSIFDKIADILKGVADLVTGHVSDFEDNMKKGFDGFAKFVKGIIKSFEEIYDGIVHGNFNEVLKGFTTLATDAVLVAMLGPLGPMLSGTAFGKDIFNLEKILVDAVAALGQVIVAGCEKLAGALGDAKANALADDNLKNCKKLGEDIITNPQFQTLMDVIAIVMIVVAVASDQYWLAGIMVIMLVANDFGGTQWVTNKIAEGLEDFLHLFGVKKTSTLKDWCKVVADLIVITAVMLTGSFSGAFEAGAEEATSTVADLGMDDAIELDDLGAQDATTATSEEAQTGEKSVARKAFDKAKSVLAKKGTALMTFGASLGFTSLGIEFAKAVGGKNDKKLQEILMILQMCISIVFSLAGGVGMGLQEDASALTQKVKGAVRKVSSTLADYLENNLSALTRLNTFVMGGGMILEGAGNAGKGAMKLMAADLVKQIAAYQADTTLFEATNKDNNAGIQQNNQHLKAIIKEFEQIVKNFDAPSKAGQGVEAALLENS